MYSRTIMHVLLATMFMSWKACLVAQAPSRPTGTLVVNNMNDHTVTVLDASSGRVVATLPTGECWAWLAGSDSPVHVKVPAKNSLHPDRRIMRGDAGPAVKPAVDVGAFVESMRASLGKVEQEAAANDPKRLRARVAELEAQVRKGGQPDQGAIDATSMVLNGLINTQLLSYCREMNIDAVGVSGVDAGLVRAHKRGPVKVDGETVDYGFVGDIDAIDTSVLNKLLDNGLMPIVSPLSADENGTLLNINGDTVAAAIGAALDAEKLMLCTGAPGILSDVNDSTSIISFTDLAGLKKLREEKKIVDGMLPKAKAIEDAIKGGVRRVHVLSYKSPEGILAEVFTNEGAGTLIVADVKALSAAEKQLGGV